jgi:hypothetical protein
VRALRQRRRTARQQLGVEVGDAAGHVERLGLGRLGGDEAAIGLGGLVEVAELLVAQADVVVELRPVGDQLGSAELRERLLVALVLVQPLAGLVAPARQLELVRGRVGRKRWSTEQDHEAQGERTLHASSYPRSSRHGPVRRGQPTPAAAQPTRNYMNELGVLPARPLQRWATMRRLVCLAAALVATLVGPSGVARAEDHEAYEEVLPKIAEATAAPHPESPWHAKWQQLHGLNLEFTSMLLGFYGDRELALKLRNMEPQMWAAQLATRALGGPIKRRLVLHPLNISHSGTMNDPNLPAYLHQRGISNEGLAAGRKFLFVDGSYYLGDTYRSFVRAAFGEDQIGKQPLRVVGDSNANVVPHTWVVLNAHDPSLLGTARTPAEFEERELATRWAATTDWEFSTNIPHFTGNADHFALRNGEWKAMARTDRKVWSADQLPTGSAEGERARSLTFIEDLKAYFTRPDVRAKMATRIRQWRQLRAHTDRGDAHRLADDLEALHATDPGHGEAVARDLVAMLRAGHAGRRAPVIPDSVGQVRQAGPILPGLVEHLRSLPKR